MGKIVITFGIEKLECVATRRWKKTEDRPMFTRFERDGRTDRHLTTAWAVCVCIASRRNKYER